MNQINVTFFILICTVVQAQVPSENSEGKLSKVDKIWLAAYDDTTKALAQLFILKRKAFNSKQKINYLVAGISTATLVAGGLILKQDLNEPNATYEAENYAGLIFMLVGSSGIIYSVSASIVNFLQLNPYTLKKFERVLALHQEGKPIPPFYQKRLTKFLR